MTALDGDRLRLLRGADDPGQSSAIAASWPAQAEQLAQLRDEDGQQVVFLPFHQVQNERYTTYFHRG